MVKRSSSERRLIAEITPTGIPIRIQITKAPMATENVTGRRLKISDLTETSLWNE